MAITGRTSAVGPAYPFRITNGGFALFANGPGTVSFDHFRVTQYPDPAMILDSTGRVAYSNITWDSTEAPNTAVVVKTSTNLGGTWTPVTKNTPIGSYYLQPSATVDTFAADSSASFTSTNRTGGATATVTYDTVNSRITIAGGTNAIYAYTAINRADVDFSVTLDESNTGGLVWRYVDANNFYYAQINDSGNGNTLTVARVVANARTQLATTAISFPHLTRAVVLRVVMTGSVIIVYYDDDNPIITYTDATPLASAGLMGFYNNGGTARYYQIVMQPLGDDLTGTRLDIEMDLTTTDPSVTPILTDFLASTRGPTIADGALVPALHAQDVPFRTYFSREMESLTRLSATSLSDFYWDTDQNKRMIFTDRYQSYGPQCINTSDLLYSPNIKPLFSADLYRNRQTITNVTGTVDISNEKKIADGVATSWQLQYPVYSAPSITVNGIVKTVGIQGVDTGKDFYWQANSTSISQDTTLTTNTTTATPLIANGSIINFTYTGQFVTSVTRNNIAEQAARQTAEPKTSGIIEAWEDGQGMLVDNAVIYADSLLARYSLNNSVEITCTTDKINTITQGMQVAFFLPEYQLLDVLLFVVKVVTRGMQKGDGNVYYTYEITATNGPNLNRWASVLGY